MKTIKEINAAIHDGETAPIICIDDFLAHVTRGRFDELFAQLDPKLQSHVIEHAKFNVHAFDAIIEEIKKDGPAAALEPWLAFKEWMERQPWVEEALARPKPIEWTREQTDAFLAAEQAEALANMGRHFQGKADGKPDADAWKAAVAELEATAKQIADHADVIVPKKKM